MELQLTQEEMKAAEKFHNIFDRNMRCINKWWEEEWFSGDELNAQVLKQAQNISVNAAQVIGYYGMTIFHQLVWHNYYEAAEILLKKGIDPDVRGGEGKGNYTEAYKGVTPLHIVCYNGNLKMVKLLLKYGADSTVIDDAGRNCFHFLAHGNIDNIWCGVSINSKVAAKQRLEIAKFLKCDINRKDNSGETALIKLMHGERSVLPVFLTDVFIDMGADVTIQDNNGNTALMIAALDNQVSAAISLMQHKEQINFQNHAGDTALHISMRKYKDAISYMLIENDADMSIQNKQGETPAMLAKKRDSELMTKYVEHRKRFTLKELLDIIERFAANWWGGAYDKYNPFVYHICRKILRKIDVDDDTELIYALKLMELMVGRHEGCAALDIFMEEGYDLCMPISERSSVTTLRDICVKECWYDISVMYKMRDLGVDLDCALVAGRTPANILASHFMRWNTHEGVHEAVTEALQFVSTESMEELNNEGYAAIHLAVMNNSYMLLQEMIDRGVDIQLTTDGPAEPGNTPLHLACIHQNARIVKILMDAGADDTIRNNEGETPAHCLFLRKTWPWKYDSEKSLEILKILKNVDIPTRKTSETPLLMAQRRAGRYLEEITELLIDKGADVNHADEKGNTPLSVHADYSCERDIVKLLLKEGADINAKDEKGNNVLYYVMKQGDCELARLLIKKGADYNAANNKGETPVELAVEKGYETVLELMTDIKIFATTEDSGTYDDEDYDDDDYNDDDEDYDDDKYYTEEQRAIIEREKEFQVLLNTYSDIFGEELGNQLATIVMRMSEMNQNGLVPDNMEEYMALSAQFQSIMSAEDGMKKIAEYNAYAATKRYAQEDEN